MARICCHRLLNVGVCFCRGEEAKKRERARRDFKYLFSTFPHTPEKTYTQERRLPLPPLNRERRRDENFVSFNSTAAAAGREDVQQIWFNLLPMHRMPLVHCIIALAMLTILFYLNLKFEIEEKKQKQLAGMQHKFVRWEMEFSFED